MGRPEAQAPEKETAVDRGAKATSIDPTDRRRKLTVTAAAKAKIRDNLKDLSEFQCELLLYQDMTLLHRIEKQIELERG
eukprot:7313652-Lingulodinium_polyedra.AAC.1